MIAVAVDESGPPTIPAAACVHCKKHFTAGDVALVESQDTKFFVHRELAWHRRCIEEVLAGAPKEWSEVSLAVDAIREQIATNGQTMVGMLLDDRRMA